MNRNITAIEIERVANGYIVRPAHEPYMGGRTQECREIHVFASFEALSKWLCDHFPFPGACCR